LRQNAANKAARYTYNKSKTNMTTVAIVEDQKILRESLKKLIAGDSEYRCLGVCGSAEEALQQIPLWKPEVVVMDIHLPKMSGIECTRRLKELCPNSAVLILTVYEDNESIFEALRAGARGYLLKRAVSDQILRAIQDVKDGGGPMTSQVARRVMESFGESVREKSEAATLSVREQEILSQLTKGYANKEIADKMSVSTSTVRTHLRHIYEKLHVRSRTEAAMKFRAGS
jgi:DNA-binding NarL/FixJ family response regulator